MTAESQASELSPLVERFLRRATAEPEAPWLFERVGWDWQWRSWHRVADQVARGGEALRRAVETGSLRAPGRAGSVRLAPGAWRAGPDAVVAILSVLHAGLDLELADDPDASAASSPGDLPRVAVAGVSSEPVDCWLPSVRGPLEREPLIPLAPSAGAASGRFLVGGKPIAFLASPEACRSTMLSATGVGVDLPPRPILATGVLSLPWLVDCMAWALESDAAWALEPDADAFAASIAWVRPQVAVASRAALEALAVQLEGRARRHARLRAVCVVEVGGTEQGDTMADRALESLAGRLAPNAPQLAVLPAAPAWFCRSAT